MAALAALPASAGAPRVVASIVPVHALVAGVMDGAGTPHLLVDGGASPHTAVLRPSQAQALQEADIVFWIGPGLETFLARPLQTLSPGARRIALVDAPGMKLLPVREARGAGDGHGDGHDDGHDDGGHGDDSHGHAHRHGDTEVHVWLDPANARAMARTIAATLAVADPGRAAQYRSNARALDRRLEQLDARLGQILAPAAGQPYAVFHDAYMYLERRYGLTPAGVLSAAPDRMPGAAALRDIRRRIAVSGARCIFSEPQFPQALAATAAEGTGARIGTLDPLGAGLTPGVDAYFELMRTLAGTLAGCLAPPQPRRRPPPSRVTARRRRPGGAVRMRGRGRG